MGAQASSSADSAGVATAASPPRKSMRKSRKAESKHQNVRPSTFQFQASLPRLPIPPLEQTCAEFLRVVEPLLDDAAMKETREATRDLIADLGPELQAELQAYGATQENYVDAFWDDAYLKYSVPVPVNVNPFFVLEEGPATAAGDQILRATGLLWSTLKFARSVRTAEMAPDMVRGTPLCMSQYPKVLGSARIPVAGGDRVALHPEATHVAVLCAQQVYFFDAVAPDGALLVSVEDVAAALAGIRHDAHATRDAGEQVLPVGALTTDDREQWAVNRAALAGASEKNAAALAKIDSALIVVCLDDCAPASSAAAARNAIRGSTEGESAGGESLWNRWYDKLQLIVCANGAAQVNFEHTPADGHSVLRFASDVFTDDVLRFAQAISGKAAVRGVLQSVRFDSKALLGSDFHTEPRKLEFDWTDELRAALEASQARFLADYVEAFAVDCLEYTGFGSTLVKQHKLSPDAFAQQAMMAAVARVTGSVPNTYESVMTKAFLKGRTEAGRSVTPEALRFVDALNGQKDSGASPVAVVTALREAAKAHSAMTRRFGSGHGVDRHLYALRCCWALRRPDEPLPGFFECPGYKTLNVTVLSTSNCGNPALKLFGFGPVSEHGIGIGYIIKDRGFSFALCSKSISVPGMIEALKDVLGELRENLEEAASTAPAPAAAAARRKSSHVPGRRLLGFGK